MVGFDIAELKYRIARAEEYHRTVIRFMREDSFLELYSKWSTLTGVEKHAAINPHIYESVMSRKDAEPERSFDYKLTLKVGRCMSEFLWGYPCPFEERTLQADHLFPYALGGATDSTNLLVLCNFHNQSKGHDIHLYPNWDTNPLWLTATAENIAKRLRSQS